MEIQRVYNSTVNQERAKQLKTRFDQLFRVFACSKGAIRDTYISVINLESQLVRNAESLQHQVDRALFQKQNCSNYVQSVQDYSLNVARKKREYAIGIQKEMHLFLKEEEKYFDHLRETLLLPLETAMAKMALHEQKCMELQLRYKTTSATTENALQLYLQRQETAKQIYNISNMDYKWKNTRQKMQNVQSLEDDLRKTIDLLALDRKETSRLFLQLVQQYQLIYEQTLQKVLRMSRLNFRHMNGYLKVSLQLQRTGITDLELCEIATCLPFPEQFRQIESKIRLNNTSKHSQYSLDELVWPNFMKQRVQINDDNLVNYVDWVQTYLDKLEEISGERTAFMQVLSSFLQDNQEAQETQLRQLQKVLRENLVLVERDSALLGPELNGLFNLNIDLLNQLIGSQQLLLNHQIMQHQDLLAFQQDAVKEQKILGSTVQKQLKSHNKQRGVLMKSIGSIEQLRVKNSDTNQYLVELINRIEETKKMVRASIEESNRIIRTLVIEFVKEETRHWNAFKQNVQQVFGLHNDSLKNTSQKLSTEFKPCYSEFCVLFGYNVRSDTFEQPSNVQVIVKNLLRQDEHLAFILDPGTVSLIQDFAQQKLYFQQHFDAGKYRFTQTGLNHMFIENKGIEPPESGPSEDESSRKGPKTSRINTSFSDHGVMVESPCSRQSKKGKSNKGRRGSVVEGNSSLSNDALQNTLDMPILEVNSSIEKVSNEQIPLNETISFIPATPEADTRGRRKLRKLSKVVSIKEGERFVESFNCALIDRFVLQGKMYITDQKICFLSLFNRNKFFFGKTKMIIPKGDILYIEKRSLAKMFNTSLAILTKKGEIVFDSFLHRNTAYRLIILAFQPCQQLDLKHIISQHRQQSGQSQIGPAEEEEEQSGEIEVEGDFDREMLVSPEQADLLRQKGEEQRQNMAYSLEEYENQQSTTLEGNPSLSDAFRLLFGDNPVRIDRKKYKSFLGYIKEEKQLDTQLASEGWKGLPSHFEHNTGGVDSLLAWSGSAQRTLEYIHPIKYVPFMPKVCTVKEIQQLFILNENQFVVQVETITSKILFCDNFRVFILWVVTKGKEGLTLELHQRINFLKQFSLKETVRKNTEEAFLVTTRDITIPAAHAVMQHTLSDPVYRRQFYGEVRKQKQEEVQQVDPEQTTPDYKAQLQQLTSKQSRSKRLLLVVSCLQALLILVLSMGYLQSK